MGLAGFVYRKYHLLKFGEGMIPGQEGLSEIKVVDDIGGMMRWIVLKDRKSVV